MATKKEVIVLDFGGFMALMRLSLNDPRTMNDILSFYELWVDKKDKEHIQKEVEKAAAKSWGADYKVGYDRLKKQVKTEGVISHIPKEHKIWTEKYGKFRWADKANLTHTWVILEKLSAEKKIDDERKNMLFINVFGFGHMKREGFDEKSAPSVHPLNKC